MKEAKIGEVTVLIGRTGEASYFASGNKCTHYGAPFVAIVVLLSRVSHFALRDFLLVLKTQNGCALW